jgi:hypothetical protein
MNSEEMRPEAIATIQKFLCDDHELDVNDPLGPQVHTSTSPPEMLQSGKAVFELGVNADSQNNKSSPEEIMESNRGGAQFNSVEQVCSPKGIKRKTCETLENSFSSAHPVHSIKDISDIKTKEHLPHKSSPKEIAMKNYRHVVQVEPLMHINFMGIKKDTCDTLENSLSEQPVHQMKSKSHSKTGESIPHNSSPEDIDMESNRNGVQVDSGTQLVSSKGIKRKNRETLENSSFAFMSKNYKQ